MYRGSDHSPVHPRERGERRHQRVLDEVLIRFIPASAGNASHAINMHVVMAVHPRERGERAFRAWLDAQYYGSSPRARGTRPPPIATRRGASVHPRERGERFGNRVDIELATRFIPASAGNAIVSWVC